ncbi:MAG: AAA family ATPase [Myxococcota bacterium]|nr:AAA family ATPase [Myxococcota bacterium]
MKNNHPVFIVLEGLDGSGKSTTARLLAEAFGAVCMTTPTPVVRGFRDELIESFEGSQEAAQLFYLATVFDASQRIQSLLARGQSVVLDRYFLSTQAYAAFRGSTLDLDAFSASLQPADLTVFIDVPLELRRERLLGRGANAADRETLADATNATLLEEFERRRVLDVVGELLWLDAVSMDPDEVVATILRALARR